MRLSEASALILGALVLITGPAVEAQVIELPKVHAGIADVGRRLSIEVTGRSRARFAL